MDKKVKIFSAEELNEKTVIELRELCRKYELSNYSKARKDVLIDGILEYYKELEGDAAAINNNANDTNDNDNNGGNSCYQNQGGESKIPFINAGVHSVLQPDDTYHTMVSVSCGAASNNYPVVGKTVGFVKATYREILNIDDAAEGLVNGVGKEDSYVLKSCDILEFVRKAGKKG